jgi:hypothetical protein
MSAAAVLSQCGVKLAQVELVLVDAPQQYHYFDTLVSRKLARAPHETRASRSPTNWHMS